MELVVSPSVESAMAPEDELPSPSADPIPVVSLPVVVSGSVPVLPVLEPPVELPLSPVPVPVGGGSSGQPVPSESTSSSDSDGRRYHFQTLKG